MKDIETLEKLKKKKNGSIVYQQNKSSYQVIWPSIADLPMKFSELL